MKITLQPVSVPYLETPTAISINGLTLSYNGTDYDLSVIPEGGEATAPDDSIFIGIVTRDAVTVRYPYDQSKAALHQPSDPAAYVFEVTDGPVPDPIVWRDA